MIKYLVDLLQNLLTEDYEECELVILEIIHEIWEQFECRASFSSFASFSPRTGSMHGNAS